MNKPPGSRRAAFFRVVDPICGGAVSANDLPEYVVIPQKPQFIISVSSAPWLSIHITC
jgi:hypothetical protein